MKKVIVTSVLALALTGCASSHFEFTDASVLNISKEPLQVSNEKTEVVFPLCEDYLSPNYIGGYDLNFITETNFNNQYAAYGLIKDCIGQLPFKNKEVEFVFADKVIILNLDDDCRDWAPNYSFDYEGISCVVTEEDWSRNQSLQEGYCWRNLIISKSKKRVLCVDRVKLKKKFFAIVYVMQAEKKGYPFPTLYHWNITQPELLPNIGSTLTVYADMTKRIMAANP